MKYKKARAKRKITRFTKHIARGLKQEYHETKQIPKQLRDKEYRAAAEQMGDITKMIFLTLLWILPAGGFASAVLLKISTKFRPSSFQDKKEED